MEDINSVPVQSLMSRCITQALLQPALVKGVTDKKGECHTKTKPITTQRPCQSQSSSSGQIMHLKVSYMH